MEKEENENRKENSRTALDGKLRVFKARMVVLLNPVCNWLSEMLHVFET